MKDLLEYLYWLHSVVNPNRRAVGLKNVPLFDAIKSYRIMKGFSKKLNNEK